MHVYTIVMQVCGYVVAAEAVTSTGTAGDDVDTAHIEQTSNSDTKVHMTYTIYLPILQLRNWLAWNYFYI